MTKPKTRRSRVLRMLLYDLLTVLAILTIAAAFMTHPGSDQSWLSYLLSVAKRAWSR